MSTSRDGIAKIINSYNSNDGLMAPPDVVAGEVLAFLTEGPWFSGAVERMIVENIRMGTPFACRLLRQEAEHLLRAALKKE
jgi:hypothetical protein